MKGKSKSKGKLTGKGKPNNFFRGDSKGKPPGKDDKTNATNTGANTQPIYATEQTATPSTVNTVQGDDWSGQCTDQTSWEDPDWYDQRTLCMVGLGNVSRSDGRASKKTLDKGHGCFYHQGTEVL